MSAEDYKAFERLCADALDKRMLICRMIKNQVNEILATALLLYDGKRLYNIMNTTTNAGRKAEANHFLIDRIIYEFSSLELIFDFEGSDLPGVKTFYEYFGSINQPFYMIKYNNLPWPINKFKK